MARKSSQKKESLQAFSPKELEARLRETEEAMFKLQFRHATSPLKNPMEIRHARREIARMKTLLQQKAGQH